MKESCVLAGQHSLSIYEKEFDSAFEEVDTPNNLKITKINKYLHKGKYTPCIYPSIYHIASHSIPTLTCTYLLVLVTKATPAIQEHDFEGLESSGDGYGDID